MILYHGSPFIVQAPEIRITRFHKDFYFGFYTIICGIYILQIFFVLQYFFLSILYFYS